jgi:glutamyl-Q tRNA(Asp) synthetase
MNKPLYRGRFAPSPTGPLHLGSLIAATASYLQARSQGGYWGVRIEDIDPPREVAGASDDMLRTLEVFGFEWDGPVLYQSTRYARYEAALERLRALGLAYPCGCSRKTIIEHSPDGIYSGTCREGLPAGSKVRSWRLRTPDQPLVFHDKIQGTQTTDLCREAGDFVLLRADGLFAYQLAAGLDDAETGITEVVRGADLLDSTPRQRYIQQVLGLSSPDYAHHPVVFGQHGQKLSKQTHASPLDAKLASQLLATALDFLGHPPPASLRGDSLDQMWQWAIQHWRLEQIPKIGGRRIEKLR